MKRELFAVLSVVSLSGCGPALFQAPPHNDYISVIPESPKIGSAFTLRVDNALNPSANFAPIPDGVYPVYVSIDERVERTNGDLPVPTTQTTPYPIKRVQIGTIDLKDGKGQAQFVLKANYGDGVPPRVGGPVIINFIRPEFTGVVGFRVGGN